MSGGDGLGLLIGQNQNAAVSMDQLFQTLQGAELPRITNDQNHPQLPRGVIPQPVFKNPKISENLQAALGYMALERLEQPAPLLTVGIIEYQMHRDFPDHAMVKIVFDHLTGSQ